MKILRAIGATLLLVFACHSNADQTATVRMHCYSLRFHRATTTDGVGFQWRLDLTTLDSGINGELASGFLTTNYTHSSYAKLYYEWDNTTYSGAIGLDIPDAGDANGNGFPDFFEVSQPVNGLTSDGVLNCSSYFVNSAAQVTWYRNAGSSVGQCNISVPDPWSSFGTMTFVHLFDLIEYNGTLSYTPGASTVAGMLSLTDTNIGGTLNGPVVFEKSVSEPHDQLTLKSASLTNENSQVLSLYADSTIYHDAIYPTNYYGFVEFQDGDPNTLADDYYLWVLSIDDTNDTDGDGIPDFSDDVATVPPNPPVVSIALGSTNVWLTITGDVGHVHEIESAGSLTSTNWTTVRSVALTNSPQMESLPRPTDTTFWRVRALP